MREEEGWPGQAGAGRAWLEDTASALETVGAAASLGHCFLQGGLFPAGGAC